MAKPKKYEVVITNLRGIGIQHYSGVHSLELAIMQAQSHCYESELSSYDKIWRGIKNNGGFAQVVELAGTAPNFYTCLGAVIISPQDAQPQGRYKPGQHPTDTAPSQPQQNTDPAAEWENAGVSEKVWPGPSEEDEPITYSWRVFWSYHNHVTKQLNKTTYAEVFEARTAKEAQQMFEAQQKERGAKGYKVRSVEVAGSL